MAVIRVITNAGEGLLRSPSFAKIIYNRLMTTCMTGFVWQIRPYGDRVPLQLCYITILGNGVYSPFYYPFYITAYY